MVSELVTNAIRLRRPPIRLRLIHDATTLICEVSDTSHTAPHLRRAKTWDEGGRGLLLVAQLTQRWGSRHTRRGQDDLGGAEPARRGVRRRLPRPLGRRFTRACFHGADTRTSSMGGRRRTPLPEIHINAPLAESLSVALLVAVWCGPCSARSGWPEAVVAVPAAGVVIAAGAISPDHAAAEAERLGPVIGFLAAVLVLAHLCDVEGLFHGVRGLDGPRGRRARPAGCWPRCSRWRR